MKKITLTAISTILILFAKSQTIYPSAAEVGVNNPVDIYDGYLTPLGPYDSRTLEIHATKLNVGAYNSKSYASSNTALFNVWNHFDGVDIVKFKTITEAGYFRIVQAQFDKYVAEFVNNGQPQLYLNWTNNYNIGIGTNTPNADAKLDVNGSIYANDKISIGEPTFSKIIPYKLAVNGTAIFNKAIVRSNSVWPDYIFKKEYKLPKLEEIEQFINVNGHLPEMPSAVEVEKNGIDLGNTQALLLKKIEELTLIIIDQNKSLVDQQKRISDLESKIQK